MNLLNTIHLNNTSTKVNTNTSTKTNTKPRNYNVSKCHIILDILSCYLCYKNPDCTQIARFRQ